MDVGFKCLTGLKTDSDDRGKGFKVRKCFCPG